MLGRGWSGGPRGQTGCPGEVTLYAPGAELGAVGDGSLHVTLVWHRAPGAAQMGMMPPVSTS